MEGNLIDTSTENAIFAFTAEIHIVCAKHPTQSVLRHMLHYMPIYTQLYMHYTELDKLNNRK